MTDKTQGRVGASKTKDAKDAKAAVISAARRRLVVKAGLIGLASVPAILTLRGRALALPSKCNSILASATFTSGGRSVPSECYHP